jgi:hypothetical protein
MDMTKEGVPPVAMLDPYKRVEAETIAWESGIETAKNDAVGVYVTGISNGDFIKVCNVDFAGTGAAKFLASVASVSDGGTIELRLDNTAGALVGTLNVKSTGGLDKWEMLSCAVSGAKGVHDLILKFTGGSEPGLNFDWWKYESTTTDK